MKLFSMRKIMLNKIIAAGLTAAVSPLAMISLSGNLTHISGAFNAAAEYIRLQSEEVRELPELPVNNGSVLLYVPEFPDMPAVYEPPADEKTPAQVKIPVISQNISLEREDLSRFTSQNGTIVNMTFRPAQSTNNVVLAGGGRVRNNTGIADELLLEESIKPLTWQLENTDEPQVLIIHTHTTEGFRLSEGMYYDPKYIFRTTDSGRNIVAVGAAIAEELAKQGIGVIHDGTIHDYPVFRGAYARSADTVRSILAEHPSIKVVLDIHRDGIESNGNPVAAVAEINGREAAQIMIISPADNGEWGIPNFMQNFRFAAGLQNQMENDHTGLTRAVLFQYCNYNLHLSPGALLIEVGSHGNTLDQAIYGGQLFGQSLAQLLLDLIDET